jgi:acetyltransferase
MRSIATVPLASPLPEQGSVHIRRVHEGDADGLLEFYGTLSPQSRHRRFLGFCSVTEGVARQMCGPDHRHAEGFVAELHGGADDGRIVGHLCLEPADDGAEEVALAVADEFQGRGIGRALYEAALSWARSRGVPTLVATAMADNTRILRLLISASPKATVRPSACGTVDVFVPLGELRSLSEPDRRCAFRL